MTPVQCPDDSYAKFCKLAHAYGEVTLNSIICDGVDFSIYHRLRKKRGMNPHANVTSIALKAQSFLVNQKCSLKPTFHSSLCRCRQHQQEPSPVKTITVQPAPKHQQQNAYQQTSKSIVVFGGKHQKFAVRP